MIEFGHFLDQANQSKVRVEGASCFEMRVRECRYGFGGVVTDSGVSLRIRECRYGFGSVVLTVDDFDEARDVHSTQEFDH